MNDGEELIARDTAVSLCAEPATASAPADLPPAPGDQAPETVIDSRSRWYHLNLPELWRYRELLFFLTWRDIKIRYKQTFLGVAWAVLQPLMTTGVFAVLFGLLFGSGNEPTVPGVPYVLSTFCAMLPWQLFAESLTRSSKSLLQSREMITKVYFPRLVLPLGGTLSALADFGVALLVLAGMLAWYGQVPSWPVLTLPLFVLFAVTASMAVGLWLSALSAIYRDFEHAQPFLVRLGMFVSPVIYATASLETKLPDWALILYGLNPMVGVIEGFRWALLGAAEAPGLVMIPSVVMTLVLLASALFFFRRMEETVVDVI
jgi:lipopolysaccharide transport system permease protein